MVKVERHSVIEAETKLVGFVEKKDVTQPVILKKNATNIGRLFVHTPRWN